MLVLIEVKIHGTLNLGPIQKKYSEAFRLGGPIQMYIDSTVINGVEPYVPFKIGTLTKSGILHSKIGQGKIIWRTPYARYLWYGKSSRGKDLVFNQKRHPLAGKFWALRYKSDHIEELRRMVAKKVASL